MTARRFVLALLTTALIAVGLVAPAPPASAAYCGINWGSTPEERRGASAGWVTQVRSGRHDCYDRVVLNIADGAGLDWYDVRYVDEVRTDGSGAVVPTRGGASLQVVVFATNHDNHDFYPNATVNTNELANVARYRTLRQVVWAGEFEGMSTVGIGTRARLPFRAFILSGPANDVRVVVDIAHAW
jgi:hypothetical protein